VSWWQYTLYPRHKPHYGSAGQLCPEVSQQITLLNSIDGAALDCAHLEIPLDYTNSSLVPLELSLFTVNATQESRLGSVLINFRGPGGTGAQMPLHASQMAANIGPQWDLVSRISRGTVKIAPFNCGTSLPELPAATGKKSTGAQRAETGQWESHRLLSGRRLGCDRSAGRCMLRCNERGRPIHQHGFHCARHDQDRGMAQRGRCSVLLRLVIWYSPRRLHRHNFHLRIERMVHDVNANSDDYRAGFYGDFVRDAEKAFGGFLVECFNNKQRCALTQ
jgi:hypothetical protein